MGLFIVVLCFGAQIVICFMNRPKLMLDIHDRTMMLHATLKRSAVANKGQFGPKGRFMGMYVNISLKDFLLSLYYISLLFQSENVTVGRKEILN